MSEISSQAKAYINSKLSPYKPYALSQWDQLANDAGGFDVAPGPNLGFQDKYDAFRHSYSSAVFAINLGAEIAKTLGDHNETHGLSDGLKVLPTDPIQLAAELLDRNMDYFNTAVDRSYADPRVWDDLYPDRVSH
jgi:hypothetical protein